MRIYNIETAPPGVYPDEAVNGIDAMSVIESGGNFSWFYPANNGREGLFMNLIALCFYVGGISVLTLKFPSIFFGTLTILGTYLLTYELFKKRQLAAISAFLVAVSFWAVNFNRISFRANMLPFVLAFSFYFLWKGINTTEKSYLPSLKSYRYFGLGGLFFGLGLHTYIAFRIAPAILVVMFFVFLLTRKGFLKSHWKQLMIFIAGTAITTAPMIYTLFIAHPEYMESRSASISIFTPEVNQGDLAGTFLKSFGLSLAKYNFWGDQNWRHNYPPYPILDPITGVSFAFGFIYSIVRFVQLGCRRILKRKNCRLSSPPQQIGEEDNGWLRSWEIHTFLLGWFFLMLAPEFLTAEGNPHALRAIGTLPVTFIFASLTFNYFLEKSRRYSYIYKRITYGLIAATLITIGIFNVVKYHYFWAREIETARAFDKTLMSISNYIKTTPEQKEKYVIAEVMQRIPIELFNWKRPYTYYLYPEEINAIRPLNKNNFEVLMTDRNDNIIKEIKTKFPELKEEEKKDDMGLSFYVLKP